MEKYKKLGEDKPSDGTNLDMITLMESIGKQLEETVNKFKQIAKAKGIRYEIAAAKKDAIEKRIMDGSDGSVTQSNEQKSKSKGKSHQSGFIEPGTSSMSTIKNKLANRNLTNS